MSNNFPYSSRPGRDREGNTSLIAVLGATGSGKTAFISSATGSNLQVGHSLISCTENIEPHTFPYRDQLVTLVDTPGFGDPNKHDIVVLEELTNFLQEYSRKGIYLSGIIFLHRITDNRVGASTRGVMRLLYQLCGEEFMEHISLVTTMWDNVEPSIGDFRENGLKETLWNEFLRGGAQVQRHHGTQDSAINIIEHLLQRSHRGGTPTSIQQESIEGQTPLSRTSAGRIAFEALTKSLEKFDLELNELNKTLSAESSEPDRWELQSEITKLTSQREEIYRLLGYYDGSAFHDSQVRSASEEANDNHASSPSWGPNEHSTAHFSPIYSSDRDRRNSSNDGHGPEPISRLSFHDSDFHASRPTYTHRPGKSNSHTESLSEPNSPDLRSEVDRRPFSREGSNRNSGWYK